MTKPVIPVVDLFAGPGGLGEGFSALENGHAFRIVVSAEKDPIAHQTLRLRAFYRLLKTKMPDGLSDYYAFCNGDAESPYSAKTEVIWNESAEEALCIELGSKQGNETLDNAIQQRLGSDTGKDPWVLIGGPPCQAYSLVGRARNKGKVDYSAESDHRNFLYKEYLRIINRYKPAMFVMENVKGMLSATVGGGRIFHEILQDLATPARAFPGEKDNPRYKICSLVSDQYFEPDGDPTKIDANAFIIKAERYGIPQARHRVILVGIREEFTQGKLDKLHPQQQLNVEDVIDVLPKLRSRLSKEPDSAANWQTRVAEQISRVAEEAKKTGMVGVVQVLSKALTALSKHKEYGNNRVPRHNEIASTGLIELNDWLKDENLKFWLNHETRGHRIDDLGRYAFAAAFAEIHSRSPKGHTEFNLPGLAPAHKNWESGKFSDRFRVQTKKGPSTTITSHISKDGHYFIHYDPAQCRSLTVREAARLQTFPDNYFFRGGRTMQYHQVGNAVPPFLANQIAAIVYELLQGSSS